MRIVLASHNADKLCEIRQILAGTGVDIVAQHELGIEKEAEEKGETFRDNARIKARAAMEATGLPAVGDDSGLCVEALGGQPGIRSARFGGEELSYSGKCDLLLEMLKDEKNRRAEFVTSVVCVFPDGEEICSEGRIQGRIAAAKDGGNGFGYDPVYIPNGYECTMACLTAEQKNAISHRGLAFRRFAEMLDEYLNKKDRKQYDD